MWKINANGSFWSLIKALLLNRCPTWNPNLKGSQNLNVLGVYLDRISNVLQLSKDKSLILRASNCTQGCVECYEKFLWNY